MGMSKGWVHLGCSKTRNETRKSEIVAAVIYELAFDTWRVVTKRLYST